MKRFPRSHALIRTCVAARDAYALTCATRVIYVPQECVFLCKSGCVYIGIGSASFRDRRALIIRAVPFNTNLAFVKGRKKAEAEEESDSDARDKSACTWLRNYYYFSHPSLLPRRLRILCSTSFALIANYPYPPQMLVNCVRREYILSSLSSPSPFALYAANRQRLAYPKIIDHRNSRGDTWPDLHRYHLISGDLFPEARVISILDSKNSGVSYGSVNKIIRIETGNYLTNSSAYRAIKRRGRPDADAIFPSLFLSLSFSRR